jgi:hypothetical protein
MPFMKRVASIDRIVWRRTTTSIARPVLAIVCDSAEIEIFNCQIRARSHPNVMRYAPQA